MVAGLDAFETISAEYGRRLQAAVGDRKATSWAWIWYCVERHKIDGDREIYRLVTKRPKDAGLHSIFLYVKEEITLRDLFDLLRSETADVYAAALEGAGLAAADESRGYYEMTTELALEAVKACAPLRGLDVERPTTCSSVATAAATIWLRFLEAYHSRVGLLSVEELQAERVLEVMSPEERELLERNDFSGFAIRDEAERAELRRLAGLDAVPIDAGRG